MTKWEEEIPFDNVWIKLNTHDNSKIFINTIYIPGWACFEHINSYFEQLFDIINTREPYARFIILGDFNLPCIEWISSGNNCIPSSFEGRLANELINTMIVTNTKQRNPIRNKFNKVLDLIISNMDIAVIRQCGIVKEDDYHPSLFFKLDRSAIKFMKSKKEPKFNFFNANYSAISDAISNIDWQNVLNFESVDVAVDKFYDILNDLINKFTPKLTPRSDKYPKWYSLRLIQMMKGKEFYRKKKSGPDSQFYSVLFAAKRKEIKREQRICLKNMRTILNHI